MPPTLDTAVEEHVDVARSAADCIRKAVEEVKAIKNAFEQINDQDGWRRYKRAKQHLQRAGQLLSEADQALQEVSSHRNALAKEPPRPLIELAKRTADSAYQQALSGINYLQALVKEVEESYVTLVDRL